MKLIGSIKESIKESVVDGPGVRLSVFLAGCPHECAGCHNEKTWDIESGEEHDEKRIADYLAARLKEGHYSGVTISGGDPFYQEKALSLMLKALRGSIGDVDVWCYTGYMYEDLAERGAEPLIYIDVLVDGPYVEAFRDSTIPFIGSSNQRIIDLSGRRKSN